MGARRLFSGRSCVELEILLYHSYRFLNRDYIVFDGSGMVFVETNLKPVGKSLRLQEFFPNEPYDEDNYNASGTATAEIGAAVVLRIARECGKSMEWLLTGKD